MKKNGSNVPLRKKWKLQKPQANFSGKENCSFPHTLANHTDFGAYNIELGRRYQGL